MAQGNGKQASVTSQSKTKGHPPGTLLHIGKRRREKMSCFVIDYTESECNEKELKSVEEFAKFRNEKTVSWLSVAGLHDTAAIEKIGAEYGLHPLLLEDIVNTGQRPKVDEYEDGVAVILRMIDYDVKTKQLESEQVTLVVGKGFVLSFQEDDKDVFDPVRELLRKGKGKIRSEGVDFLLYRLLDVLVDSYFIVLEKIGEDIEVMEEELLRHPDPAVLSKIHRLRRDMIFVRKAVWPLREVVSTLERTESGFFQKQTLLYMRDVYDHTIQAMDTVETYRDMLGTMFDQYLSGVSNRMNEIMKVLTVIATIFMPLTFIAGIYGMNFHYMPELQWIYGYPTTLGLCAIIGIGMMIYFKKRGWL